MLVGKNIILRSLKQEDIQKTHKWRNDLELIKLTQGIRFPKTLEMDKEWFDNVLNDKANRNVFFGIDEIDSGDFIGIIQLNNIDYVSGTASWGFIIGESSSRGKGFSNEAPMLLFNYAFNTLNLRKIIGYRIGVNKNAFFMNLSLGFTEEGLLKNHVFYDGAYHNVHILSLFRENFLSKSSIDVGAIAKD